MRQTNPFSFPAKPNKSTLYTAASLVLHITRSRIASEKPARCIFLDFSFASDSVPEFLLIWKTRTVRLSQTPAGMTFRLIHQHSSVRKTELRKWLIIPVFQGDFSFLYLFSTYMNDLSVSSTCLSFTYAHDGVLSVRIWNPGVFFPICLPFKIFPLFLVHILIFQSVSNICLP